MDVAKDVIKLTGDIAAVPGLSTLSSLLIKIIDTVQVCKSNKARLQLLTHSVSEQLFNIALQMEGKWDNAPSGLRAHLDELESALCDVLKIATSLSRKGRIKTFFTSTSRLLAISRLDDRLGYINSRILVYLNIDTSIVVEDIQNVMEAQYATTMEAQSALLAFQSFLVPKDRPGENSGDEQSQQHAPNFVLPPRGEEIEYKAGKTVDTTDNNDLVTVTGPRFEAL